jgi:DNA transformation protein
MTNRDTKNRIKGLTQLPNIGAILAEKMLMVEIDSPEKLEEVGVEHAFIRLEALHQGSCFNMLCALEGAIQGIRWHQLSQERKAELKVFYRQFRNS